MRPGGSGAVVPLDECMVSAQHCPLQGILFKKRHKFCILAVRLQSPRSASCTWMTLYKGTPTEPGATRGRAPGPGRAWSLLH